MSYNGKSNREVYDSMASKAKSGDWRGASEAQNELRRRKRNGSFTRSEAEGWRDELRSQNSSSNSSGPCYITTAVCDSFHKADDCYELSMFRSFRDNWLMKQSDGDAIIKEYYATAPEIVSAINACSNSLDIYRGIWNDYLSPCLGYIENGEYQKCKILYISMVNNLKNMIS